MFQLLSIGVVFPQKRNPDLVLFCRHMVSIILYQFVRTKTSFVLNTNPSHGLENNQDTAISEQLEADTQKQSLAL